MAIQTVGVEDHHPTNWYGEMAPKEKSTFWACTGGWILDAMDVQIYSFVIPTIIAAFALTNADAGLIGTSTLLASAFGGWFAGALSDRFGRVRTLQITIAWFAVFTFLCGFAQNYSQLLFFRAMMAAMPQPIAQPLCMAPTALPRCCGRMTSPISTAAAAHSPPKPKPIMARKNKSWL